MNPDGDVEKMLGTYSAIMEEIKSRVVCLDLCARSIFNVEGWISAELGYLQLRKICELIAIGCLVAHGDIKETQASALQKKWDPAKILRQLGELHTDFFPIPVTLTIVPQVSVHMEPVLTGFLSKTDLLELYGKSGDFLHRGSLRNLLRGKITDVSPDLLHWGHKIVTLLQNHHIRSITNKRHILCNLINADDNNRVQTVLLL